MRMPVRFSQHYGLGRSNARDWFDPLITEDTKLYVDPFLIFQDEHEDWTNAHPRLMTFFNMVMEMLAESGFTEGSQVFKKAKALLKFPEPFEFCLGVSEKSIFGAGSGERLRIGMLKGAEDAIRLGLQSLRHMEELALFGEQIGADRISDMACNVLKADFIRYTQSVAKEHGIPLHQINVTNANWDPRRKMWQSAIVQLPLNAPATELKGRPVGVILTPKRFLRQMPNVDPNEFWDYALKTEGQELAASLNVEIGQHVDTGRIAELARRHRHLLTAYLQNLEASPKPAYDVDADPALIVIPSDFAKEIANDFKAEPPATEEDFLRFIEDLLAHFKHAVERGAWRNLWVRDKPRTEPHAQNLFDLSSSWACKSRDVDMTREANAGRGPVDFKASRGHSLRAVVEVKLAKSSSFWRNLENQTPTYAKAEGLKHGFFVVIQYTEADCDPDFMSRAEDEAQKVAEKREMTFKIVWVDARPKPSASKV